jgi:hypothetical protein
MYTVKLEAFYLPTELQTLLPEDTDYVYVDFEYEPAVEGNRAGHPDTWTPDEGDKFSLYTIYLHSGDVIPNPRLSATLIKLKDMCIKALEDKYSDY